MRDSEKSIVLIVPTDKTRSFVAMETPQYVKKVERRIVKLTKEIDQGKMVQIELEELELLGSIASHLDKGEFCFFVGTIASTAIPTPKIPVKDHKKVDLEGKFPTRLLVAATNFARTFPKIDYQRIREVFDREKMDYMKRTIVQQQILRKNWKV